MVATPREVHKKLLDAVTPALEDWENIPNEHNVKGIYGPLRPKFVNIGDLAWEVINDLKEYHEQWAGGIKLIPTSSYGVRFYQNGSSLMMHHDKVSLSQTNYFAFLNIYYIYCPLLKTCRFTLM